MTVFKFSNDKNNQAIAFSDEEARVLEQNMADNPQKSIADFGFLLITGGFNKIISVWDF